MQEIDKTKYGRVIRTMLEEFEKGNLMCMKYCYYRRRLRFRKKCKNKQVLFNLLKYYEPIKE